MEFEREVGPKLRRRGWTGWKGLGMMRESQEGPKGRNDVHDEKRYLERGADGGMLGGYRQSPDRHEVCRH